MSVEQDLLQVLEFKLRKLELVQHEQSSRIELLDRANTALKNKVTRLTNDLKTLASTVKKSNKKTP